MSGGGLYQVYTTSTTTVRPRRGNDDVELDDTAPLPLLIGIGLALFIGFIILVLICCLCRRRRSPTNSPTDRPANSTNYQRAPVNDGMGAGVGVVAYPMTTVPPTSYPNSNMPYPPPHMGPTVQHNYGVIGSGMNYNNVPHNQYPQQTPHFGGVPTFPPNQYIPSLPLPPSTAPHQSHSLSHSSQTSSVSGTTADPLVPSSAPSAMSAQQQQLIHHGHPNQQQILQYQQLMQPPQPQSTSIQQQQQLQFQQQQFISGRDSPALQFSQMTYNTAILSTDQGVPRMAAPSPNTMVTMGTATSTTSSVAQPPFNHQGVNLQPVTLQDSTSYTDEEE